MLLKFILEQLLPLSSKFNPLRHEVHLDNIITFYVTVNDICLDHKRQLVLVRATHISRLEVNKVHTRNSAEKKFQTF